MIGQFAPTLQMAPSRESPRACDDLETLGLDELRSLWRARYGAPPALRSPELLRLMLAWRIQAAQAGGLDRDAKLALRRPVAKRGGLEPVPGARLVREWQGRTHEVVVMSDGGFLYGGDRYGSLSEVARAITGVRWNGPRFFGLRKEALAA